MAGARGVGSAASSPNGFTRLIVEKPFGRDLESSREMTRALAEHVTEEQTYRIDHYLGKVRVVFVKRCGINKVTNVRIYL